MPSHKKKVDEPVLTDPSVEVPQTPVKKPRAVKSVVEPATEPATEPEMVFSAARNSFM